MEPLQEYYLQPLRHRREIFLQLFTAHAVTEECTEYQNDAHKAENELGNEGETSSGKVKGKEDSMKEIFTTTEPTDDLERPNLIHRPDIQWQNPDRAPYCSHLQPSYQVPLTARVTVAAKLSHRPFPVGALVPQFYGYYKPIKRRFTAIPQPNPPPSSPKPRNSSPVSELRSRNASYYFPSPHPNRTTPERRMSTNSPYMSSPKGSGSTFKARRASQPHKPAPPGQESSTELSSSGPSSSSSYFQADSSDSHTTPPTSPKFGHSVPLGHFEPQRSDASKSPKSTRAKLRKQSKPRQEQKHSPKRPKSDRTYA